MSKLKTRDEILSQMEAVKKDIEYYRAEKQRGNISDEFWRIKYRELSVISNTLQWVLGGNDRYD